MTLWQDILVAAFVTFGGLFGLIGSYGMLKLPDPMTRLHGPTKATTLGVGGVLIGSMLFFLFGDGDPSLHEILIAVLLLLTAPVTAQFIAKMHLHAGVGRADLPPTGTGSAWGAAAQDKPD